MKLIKSMIHKIVLSVFIFFAYTNAFFAQIKTVTVSGQNFAWAVKYYSENSALPVIGSPYLNSDWMMGTLVLHSNQILDGFFRYNLMDQEMEMIYKSDTLLISNPGSIKYIQFSNKNFLYLPLIERINSKEFIRFAFCEEIVKGKIGIYKNYIIDVKNNSYASNYMGGGGDGRDYYLKSSVLLYKRANSEVLRELPLNPKRLSYVMGINYLNVKEIIRKNKLDLSREKDMIKLLAEIENGE